MHQKQPPAKMALAEVLLSAVCALTRRGEVLRSNIRATHIYPNARTMFMV
jgi:hypothetical protein